MLVDQRGRSVLDYPNLEVPAPDGAYYRMGTPAVWLDPAAIGVAERLAAAAAGKVDRPSPLSYAFDLDGHQRLARVVVGCLDVQRVSGAIPRDAALVQAPAELLAPLP